MHKRQSCWLPAIFIVRVDPRGAYGTVATEMTTRQSVGVIADTHGFVDPRIHGIFAGVGHILHAGDVGTDSVIAELEQIAPVTAVIGNTDNAITLPQTAVVDLYGFRFVLHHIVDLHHPTPELAYSIEEAQPHIIVFGHTHKPFADWIEGRLYLNPGSAGKRRWDTERSVAVLHLGDGGPLVEFHSLPD